MYSESREWTKEEEEHMAKRAMDKMDKWWNSLETYEKIDISIILIALKSGSVVLGYPGPNNTIIPIHNLQ